jgi:hypothetical protein
MHGSGLTPLQVWRATMQEVVQPIRESHEPLRGMGPYPSAGVAGDTERSGERLLQDSCETPKGVVNGSF